MADGHMPGFRIGALCIRKKMKQIGKHYKAGFSMVELMIAVVILGILATLAVPRFLSSVESTKAAEAARAMSGDFTMEMRMRT